METRKRRCGGRWAATDWKRALSAATTSRTRLGSSPAQISLTVDSSGWELSSITGGWTRSAAPI